MRMRNADVHLYFNGSMMTINKKWQATYEHAWTIISGLGAWAHSWCNTYPPYNPSLVCFSCCPSMPCVIYILPWGIFLIVPLVKPEYLERLNGHRTQYRIFCVQAFLWSEIFFLKNCGKLNNLEDPVAASMNCLALTIPKLWHVRFNIISRDTTGTSTSSVELYDTDIPGA